ncbi:hypothetical protein K503DRAFT_518182 [Rhizopogon vinicolor AM-OR11-026]|uniref:Uncharacterized protein n=1 Tax=Rhizopogon vinicolor AM-OR11-026 TaxID=1314800 RepID=A0A1B7MLN5_9AGAM|nr:hypothetical protein K503DRAFT_518182 [Rhizopogon vinicolor AM-OR11-026]
MPITFRRSLLAQPRNSNTYARRRDFFIRGQRYSILPALSLDGILHLDVQDRPYTSVTFTQFIDTLLDNMNPFPQKNFVVVIVKWSVQ